MRKLVEWTSGFGANSADPRNGGNGKRGRWFLRTLPRRTGFRSWGQRFLALSKVSKLRGWASFFQATFMGNWWESTGFGGCKFWHNPAIIKQPCLSFACPFLCHVGNFSSLWESTLADRWLHEKAWFSTRGCEQTIPGDSFWTKVISYHYSYYMLLLYIYSPLEFVVISFHISISNALLGVSFVSSNGGTPNLLSHWSNTGDKGYSNFEKYPYHHYWRWRLLYPQYRERSHHMSLLSLVRPVFLSAFSIVHLHITSWLPWVCNGILVGIAVAYRDQDHYHAFPVICQRENPGGSQYMGPVDSWIMKTRAFFLCDPQWSPSDQSVVTMGPPCPAPRESGTPPTWPLPRHIETPHGDTKRSKQYWLIMVNH